MSLTTAKDFAKADWPARGTTRFALFRGGRHKEDLCVQRQQQTTTTMREEAVIQRRNGW
jgi:hypothetical protein